MASTARCYASRGKNVVLGIIVSVIGLTLFVSLLSCFDFYSRDAMLARVIAIWPQHK